MEAIKAGLLSVRVKKDGLVEHPIVMIVTVELYFEAFIDAIRPGLSWSSWKSGHQLFGTISRRPTNDSAHSVSMGM